MEVIKIGLFKKKCTYCREKIEKEQEEFREVKIPGYVGTFNKPFCSKEHANKYEEEIRNIPQSKSGGGCCG